jgi:hypothetical protein
VAWQNRMASIAAAAAEAAAAIDAHAAGTPNAVSPSVSLTRCYRSRTRSRQRPRALCVPQVRDGYRGARDSALAPPERARRARGARIEC